MIAVDEEHHTAYVEDITIIGFLLRNADLDGFSQYLEISNLVDLPIEDLSLLSGLVLITQMMLAVIIGY